MRQFDAGDVWEVSRSISRVLIEGYRGIGIMMPVGQHFTKMVPESIGKNMLVRCLFLWMTWGLVLSGWRVGWKGYDDLRKEVTKVHLARGFQRRLWDVPLLSTGASWIKYMPIPLQNAYVKKPIYIYIQMYVSYKVSMHPQTLYLSGSCIHQYHILKIFKDKIWIAHIPQLNQTSWIQVAMNRLPQRTLELLSWDSSDVSSYDKLMINRLAAIFWGVDVTCKPKVIGSGTCYCLSLHFACVAGKDVTPKHVAGSTN